MAKRSEGGSRDTGCALKLSLLNLKKMKGADGKPLKIVQKIAANDYTTFGMCLLQDENGEEVALIEKDHINKGAANVTQAILQKWLMSDAPTRTYQHLIECLEDADLGALAELIADRTGQTMSVQQENKVQATILDPRLDNFALFLKELYSSLSHKTFQNWSHLPESEFIQLAMIGSEEDSVRRGDREEEMVRQVQQGKIESVQSYIKDPIDLRNLFLADSQADYLSPQSKRVTLLEGAPGGGKSTLALHICHKWGKGDFQEIFDLVILVYLRDQAIQNAATLADILPITAEDSKMIPSLMKATRGHKVLFIFDGWDEFPAHLQTNSIVSTIIHQPQKLFLHRSTVLITSRPVSSGNLLHIAYRRVEILGFTRNQIHQYIEKALKGNSSRIKKLVEHLEKHPVVESYCYVPLHVAILVHIFLTMKGALPTTLHELFCNLVLCCIVRELKARESEADVPEVEDSSLENLPNTLKSKLNDLCVLSHKGVMEDKVVFYQNDLKKYNLPANPPLLGLLLAVQGFTITSTTFSYNFLHLSVQELLAAYHISHMEVSTQLEVFKQMFVDDSSRFEAVLHYYCGFTKLANPMIQSFISDYAQRRKSNIFELLPLLHCFYEAQDHSLCRLVCSEINGNVNEINFQLNPIDYVAIGYFIISLLIEQSCNSANSIRLRIKDSSFICQKFKLLLLELLKVSSSSSATRQRRKLEIELHGMTFTDEAAHFIVSQLDKSSLWSKLIIRDCIFSTDESFLHITEQINKTSISPRFIELHHVQLNLEASCDYNRRSQVGSYFVRLLETNKSLTHLSLSCSTIQPHIIFERLEQNTTLVYLQLSGIHANAQVALARMLKINKTLTHLDLSKNAFTSDTGNCDIFVALQHNSTLVHLNLSRTSLIATENTIQAISKMLRVNKTLTHIDLSGNCYFYSGNCGIFQSLQHNTALVYCNLSDTSLKPTGSTLQALTTMLLVNETLTHLDLSENRALLVPEEAVKSICQGVRCNTTLLYLKLENTGLKDIEAKTQILQAKNNDLTLDL